MAPEESGVSAEWEESVELVELAGLAESEGSEVWEV